MKQSGEQNTLVLRHGELLAIFSAHGTTRESLRGFLDREKGRKPGERGLKHDMVHQGRQELTPSRFRRRRWWTLF